MLDKVKFLQELELSVPRFFKAAGYELTTTRELFSWLVKNPETVEFLKTTTTPHLVPSWEGFFDTTSEVRPYEKPYAVVSVDGSQVYPDRHQGIPCYLLNSGVVHFVYGQTGAARLFSIPRVYTQLDEQDTSEDMVNCRRTEQEFEVGLEQACAARLLNPDMPLLFLADGTLIFWYLETKSPQLKDRFLKRYIDLLEGFYQERIPLVGYISLPRARDLVSLFKNGSAYNLFPVSAASYDTVVDTDIMNFFLPSNHRSALFTPYSRLLSLYPEHVRPSFLYLHSGDETIRLEIPAWVARDEEVLAQVLSIVKDQCTKGNGYPVALSEAHEQAVIKAGDREFFFKMISLMGDKYNSGHHHSQKSLKKRFVSF
ncbi:DNA double-strand break repair nuclease NurA [Candidatus Dependentiae bacterium]|nr:DNA double-strand break repair nuclease NurA [Candidatus Dependentiae bacterium]